MSNLIIDMLATLFYDIFGNPLILGLVVTSILLLVMLKAKANGVVILIVLIPAVVGFVVNAAQSNWLEIPAWIVIILFLALAFIFYMFYLFFQR